MAVAFSAVRPASIKLKVLPRYNKRLLAGTAIAVASTPTTDTVSVNFSSIAQDPSFPLTGLYVLTWDSGAAIPRMILASGLQGATGPQGPQGPAGAVYDYDTRTAAAAATIDAVVKFVRTAGYASFSDGGSSLYIRVASEPSHTGKFRSVDRYLPNGATDATNGGWWVIADHQLKPQSFGAVSTLVAGTDNSVALKNCIDAAIALRRDVILHGHFYISSTVNITGAVNIIGNRQFNIYSNQNIPYFTYRPDLAGGAITGGSIRDVGFFSENVGVRTSEAAIKVQDLTNAGGVNHHRFTGNVFRGVYRAFWTAVANDSPGQWNLIDGNNSTNHGSIFTEKWAEFEGSNFGGSVISNNVITGQARGILAGNGFANVGDLIISHNQFNTAPIGIELTGGPSYASNVAIMGNEFDAGVVSAWKLNSMVGVNAYGNLHTGGGNLQHTGGVAGVDLNLQRQIRITGTLTGSVNDWAPTSITIARVLVIASNGAYNITGISALGDERELTLINTSSFSITLVHESASSSAANRFSLPSASNFTLVSGAAIKLHYVAGTNRWLKLT